jgi:hypothetical protein
VVRDYLTTSAVSGGLGATSAEVDDTAVVAAANVCDESVAISGGTEARYTVNGTVDTSEAPKDILAGLLGAMAGGLVYTGGTWTLHAGAWVTPTVELTEDDLDGPVNLRTRISRRELFNGVRGVFCNPDDFWQPVDFPAINNQTYIDQDNGEEIWKDIDLSYTTSSKRAQRLAKIDLERARRQQTLTLQCKLTAMRVRAGDVVMVSLERFGFSQKTFQVVEWQLATRSDGDAPRLGIDMVLRETDANVFAWSSSEETVLPAADLTDLPDPFTVDTPGLTVSDEMVTTASGTVSTDLICLIGESDDGFFGEYEVQVQRPGETAWRLLGRGSGTEYRLSNAVDGATYSVRARAINTLGVRSEWRTRSHTVVGQSARPDDVTGFSVNIVGGNAYLAWPPVSDADLSHYELRFSPAVSGATWGAASVLVERIGRPATSITVPAMVGTWLLKAVDLKGNKSTSAALVVSTVAEIEGLNAVETVTESPSFAGTKSQVAVVGSGLRLDYSRDIFADADFFAPADWFLGDDGIYSSGTYTFANSVDLSQVYTSRLTAAVTAGGVNLATDFFAPQDVFAQEDVFGADPEAWSVQLDVRTTEDNPAGSPVWSGWQPFVVGDYTARAFQFRAVLTSTQFGITPVVTGLSVQVDMPDRVEAGQDLVIPAAGTRISFSPAFKGLTGLSYSGQDMATGDRIQITNKSTTGFDVRFFTSAGAGVQRSLDYVAKGYGRVA